MPKLAPLKLDDACVLLKEFAHVCPDETIELVYSAVMGTRIRITIGNSGSDKLAQLWDIVTARGREKLFYPVLADNRRKMELS